MSNVSIDNSKQTILNPSIPFAETILGGLQPGRMVLIKGAVPEDSDRFAVDLQCGNGVFPSAVVAFHINPRFEETNPCIVCNSCEQDNWENEETSNEMPFKLGANFEMIIEVLKDMFKVVVNGAHVLEYKQRVDLNKVDTIAIHGKVQIDVVDFISNSTLYKDMANMNAFTFNGKIPCGLSPGHTITVKGTVFYKPVSFTINLCVASTDYVALHLKPYFKTGLFVRNSRLSKGWGLQETSLPSFPFSAGKDFEVIVQCEADQFKVSVNGVHQLDYKYRFLELNLIKQLVITGDMVLYEVNMW